MNCTDVIKEIKIFGDVKKHNENTIYIAFGIDKNYARPMGVFITSILENNEDVNFHVFADEIDISDQNKLDKTMSKYNSCCTWYKVDSEGFKNFPTTLNWTMGMYFRFIAGEYFYKKLSRIIYFDADMICIGKLDTLWNIKMDAGAICAVKDLGLPPGRLQRINHHGDGYFNSGALLIDIDKWHQENIFQRAMKMLNENPNIFEALDQDVLNLLYQNNVIWLGDKYNQGSNHSDKYPEDTVIIHFTGTPKPWLAWYYCNAHAGGYWKHYSDISFWCDVPVIDTPRTTREIRLMSRTFFQKSKYFESAKWYLKYLFSKLQHMMKKFC